MKRYIWDDFKNASDRGLKNKPKDKNDDHPAMMRYLLNSDPTLRGLVEGGQIFRRRQSYERDRAQGSRVRQVVIGGR